MEKSSEKMQDIRNKMKPYLSEEERAEQAAILAKEVEQKMIAGDIEDFEDEDSEACEG